MSQLVDTFKDATNLMQNMESKDTPKGDEIPNDLNAIQGQVVVDGNHLNIEHDTSNDGEDSHYVPVTPNPLNPAANIGIEVVQSKSLLHSQNMLGATNMNPSVGGQVDEMVNGTGNVNE